MAVCFTSSRRRRRSSRSSRKSSGRPHEPRPEQDVRLDPQAQAVGGLRPADLRSVPPGRFQVLDMDRDCAIKDFVLETAHVQGPRLLRFTKTETIQNLQRSSFRIARPATCSPAPRLPEPSGCRSGSARNQTHEPGQVRRVRPEHPRPTTKLIGRKVPLLKQTTGRPTGTGARRNRSR